MTLDSTSSPSLKVAAYDELRNLLTQHGSVATSVTPSGPLSTWTAGFLEVAPGPLSDAVAFEELTNAALSDSTNPLHFAAIHLLCLGTYAERDTLSGTDRTLEDIRTSAGENLARDTLPSAHLGLRQFMACAATEKKHRTSFNLNEKPLKDTASYLMEALEVRLTQAAINPYIRMLVAANTSTNGTASGDTTRGYRSIKTSVRQRYLAVVRWPILLLLALALGVAGGHFLPIAAPSAASPSATTKSPTLSDLHVRWVNVNQATYELTGTVRNLGPDEVIWNYISIINGDGSTSSYIPMRGPCSVRGVSFACPVDKGGRPGQDVGKKYRVIASVISGKQAAQGMAYYIDNTTYGSYDIVPHTPGKATIKHVDTTRG